MSVEYRNSEEWGTQRDKVRTLRVFKVLIIYLSFAGRRPTISKTVGRIYIGRGRESQNRINDFGPFTCPKFVVGCWRRYFPTTAGVHRNQHETLYLSIRVILTALFINNGNVINKRFQAQHARKTILNICERRRFRKNENSSPPLRSNDKIYCVQFASS